MTQSQIARIPPGNINEVNDEIIAGTPIGSQGGGSTTPTLSKTAGQLGKWADLDIDMLRYNAALGTLFGGEYQYVLLSHDEPDSPAIPVGTLLYWDQTVDPSAFQVVQAVSLGNEAGYVVSPVWTPGWYAWIFRYGQAAQLTPIAST